MADPEESTSIEPAVAPEYYTWTFPGAPVRVHLYLSVVDRLSREVRRAYDSIPSRHVEIGGILLGSADVFASHIIEIKDFEPILCEYRSDNKFEPSDADRRKLEKTLAARREAADDKLTVVGYYRSHTGDGLAMSEADVSIAQTFFDDPASVVLLIKPSEDGSASAGFFFWDNGRIDSEFTFLEFPFEAQQLAVTRVKPTRVRSRPHIANPSDDAAHEPGRLQLSTQEEPPLFSGLDAGNRPSGSFRWFWYLVLLMFGFGLGAVGYQVYTKWPFSSASASASSDAPALSLQVERRGEDLRISWNRNSTEVRIAKYGTLSIRDGETQHQELHLSLDQLRTGSVLYTPANTTVQFRLEIIGVDGSSTSETVVALTSPKHTSIPAPVPPAVRPASSPAGIVDRPSAREDFGEPVRVVMLNASTGDHKVSARPVESAPFRTASFQPAVTPVATPTDSTIAVEVSRLESPAETEIIPAKSIREARPAVPANLSSMITSEVQVDVRVEIDAMGRVTQARPLASTGPVSAFLVASARAAARLWLFEPARRGSQNVPSEMVLKFRYTPIPRN
jgi:outer membrane biosynthesis protein TonB